MPRVLITGAAGFIGSHLTDAYLADGWNVIGVDNFITGDAANLDAARARGAQLVEADVSAPWEPIDAAIADAGGIDCVLHFASPASPVDYGAHPIETLRVNSIGTEHAARCALRHGARFLYASTSESYGDPLEHPQRETYWGNVNPVGVRSCYDEAKRYGEAFVSTMIRSAGLDGRIIRIFNTYGPRMRPNDGRVVPNFVGQALRGAALTIYGDGRQTRSFCYVADLVRGIRLVAASDATRGKVVNLGNPREETIRAFAEIICRLVGVPLDVVHRDLPPDDPTRRCPDIGVAHDLVGWEPQVELEDGLRATIAFFTERR